MAEAEAAATKDSKEEDCPVSPKVSKLREQVSAARTEGEDDGGGECDASSKKDTAESEDVKSARPEDNSASKPTVVTGGDDANVDLELTAHANDKTDSQGAESAGVSPKVSKLREQVAAARNEAEDIGKGEGDASLKKDSASKEVQRARREDETTLKSTAVAGENEDNVDTELALELSKQELLFQKSLRKRAGRDKQKKEDLAKKRADQKKMVEQAMEASFDNEVDALLTMFDNGLGADTCDDHGTTLLSEAAAGGAGDVLEVLLCEGCDPNSIGRYRRTPLWRAAYAGQTDLIRRLLRSGSDPRDNDEEGARPVDVASNEPSRELLLCWDTTATEKVKKEMAGARKKKAEQVEKEERQKTKRQDKELSEAIEEAERKVQIAKCELARTRKLLSDYRTQKISYVEQGASDKLNELEPLLEKAEGQMKVFETTIQEWEWKAARAKLKQSDFHQQQKEKAEKKAGKVQGFKLEVTLESLEEFSSLIEHLTLECEVKATFEWKQGVELVKGDTLIKDGQFAHLLQSEFTTKALKEYGTEPAAPEEAAADSPVNKEGEGEDKSADAADRPVEEEIAKPFPLIVNFARGFCRTIEIKAISDVLMKDVGGLRQADGRWPLVIDPSGRTSTFIKYTGAAVFHLDQLRETEPVHLKKALLRAMMHGSAVMIDIGPHVFDEEVLQEPFSNVEPGLLKKLTDRTVLYSYLLPKRFKSLLTPDVIDEFVTEGMFLDDALQKFVFGFITEARDPEFNFAKQFYTISVRAPDDVPELP